ncbi:MAG: phosphomannomutase [Bermanella sp.]|jgi:phosphomannomutase
MSQLSCFKAYDVRGRLPDQLNDEIAYRIGRAYGEYLKPKTVVVGYDIRLTSLELSRCVIQGLTDAGADVIDIGECGTEEIYFATSYLKADGGVCITASHNPKDYNGMKFVRDDSKPISGDTGLKDIQILAEENSFPVVAHKGKVTAQDTRPPYIEHLLTYVNIAGLKPLNIVCNAGNGGAGAVIDAIEGSLPFNWTKVHHNPDGNFPHGVPNPLLEQNRSSTIEAIKETKADLGIAWDGDFDRCFFFDETGNFIEGYYIVGLLAEAFLKKKSGEKVVHDPRLVWNTIAIAEEFNGEAVESKTGHAFIKERMRLEDAVYGGEMSAHHYFRDFFYCDSGMIPWLLVAELISSTGKPLSQLVKERTANFPCSGEINSTLKNPQRVIDGITSIYSENAVSVNHTDGISINFDQWRFNLRSSNTEPVVRLNVESKGDKALMELKTKELLDKIAELDS